MLMGIDLLWVKLERVVEQIIIRGISWFIKEWQITFFRLDVVVSTVGQRSLIFISVYWGCVNNLLM